MPATPKQMRSAGRELQLRRDGKVKQEANRAVATRIMGSMSDENLRRFASWPDPQEQKTLATKELERRLRGIDQEPTIKGKDPTRSFGTASLDRLKFYVRSSLDDIRKDNGQTLPSEGVGEGSNENNSR